MFNIMAVVALTTGLSAAYVPQAPSWLDDYATAQRTVRSAHKPMAVFVGSGKEGWTRVVQDGAVDSAVTRLLAQKYVCVYVDTDTASGRALAGAFQVANRALIISDASGSSQAYSLSGTLTRAELGDALAKYADPERPSSVTETIVREAPPAPPAAPVYRAATVYRSGST